MVKTLRIGTSTLRAAVLTLATLALGMLGSRSAVAQETACVPSHDTVLGPPTLDDGKITGDAAWAKATKFNLTPLPGSWPASTPPLAELLLLRTTTEVFLGVRVNDAAGATASDVIQIGIAGNGNCSDAYHLIFGLYDTAGNLNPTLKHFAKGYCTAGFTPSPPPFPAWLTTAAKGHRYTGPDGYEFEFKIPISAADDLSFTGTPRLFVAVHEQFNGSGDMFVAPWPAGTALTDVGALFDVPPSANQWGEISFSASACTGLDIDWSDVGIDHSGNPDPAVAAYPESKVLIPTTRPDGSAYPPPASCVNCPPPPTSCPDCPRTCSCTGVPSCTEPFPNASNLAPTAVNPFFADIHNDGPAAAGIVAKYAFAPWGIPVDDEFIYVAKGELAAVPAGTAAPTTTRLTAVWNPTYWSSCRFAERTHRCMKVELSSTSTGTRFKRSGTRRNMDFVPASTFTRQATLSTPKAAAPGGGPYQYVLSVQSNVQQYACTQQIIVPGATHGRTDGSVAPGDTGGSLETPVITRGPCKPITPKEGMLTYAAPVDSSHFPAGLTEGMVWITRAFRHAKDKVRVNGTDYNLLHYQGAFGYLVGHNSKEGGAVLPVHWEQQLTAQGLNGMDKENHLYTVSVQPGQSLALNTRVTAEHEGTGATGGTGGTGGDSPTTTGSGGDAGTAGTGGCTGACCRCGGEPATGGTANALTMIIGAVGSVFILGRGLARRRRQEDEDDDERDEKES